MLQQTTVLFYFITAFILLWHLCKISARTERNKQGMRWRYLMIFPFKCHNQAMRRNWLPQFYLTNIKLTLWDAATNIYFILLYFACADGFLKRMLCRKCTSRERWAVRTSSIGFDCSSRSLTRWTLTLCRLDCRWWSAEPRRPAAAAAADEDGRWTDADDDVLAMYCRISLDASVLPAPDSPDISTHWSDRSRRIDRYATSDTA